MPNESPQPPSKKGMTQQDKMVSKQPQTRQSDDEGCFFFTPARLGPPSSHSATAATVVGKDTLRTCAFSCAFAAWVRLRPRRPSVGRSRTYQSCCTATGDGHGLRGLSTPPSLGNASNSVNMQLVFLYRFHARAHMPGASKTSAETLQLRAFSLAVLGGATGHILRDRFCEVSWVRKRVFHVCATCVVAAQYDP